MSYIGNEDFYEKIANLYRMVYPTIPIVQSRQNSASTVDVTAGDPLLTMYINGIYGLDRLQHIGFAPDSNLNIRKVFRADIEIEVELELFAQDAETKLMYLLLQQNRAEDVFQKMTEDGYMVQGVNTVRNSTRPHDEKNKIYVESAKAFMTYDTITAMFDAVDYIENFSMSLLVEGRPGSITIN